MTTIAYKDGVLAADGRMTTGTSIMTDSFNKIFDVQGMGYTVEGDEVLAFGLAGFLSAKATLEYCMKEGLKVTSAIDSEEGFAALVVCRNTTWFIAKDEEAPNLSFIEIPEGIHWAIGSGKAIANHYLHTTGCDPLDAVIEACKTDTGSGGQVTRWER